MMEPITITLETAKEIYEVAKTIQKVNNVSKEMKTVAESEGLDQIAATRDLVGSASDLKNSQIEKSEMIKKDIGKKSEFVDKLSSKIQGHSELMAQNEFVETLPADAQFMADQIQPDTFVEKLENFDNKPVEHRNFGLDVVDEADSPHDKLPRKDNVLSDRELNEPLDDIQEIKDSHIPTEQSDVNPDSISDLDEGIGKANKEAGCRRECEVEQELDKKYPESEGYDVISEAYLRNENGEIVQDPISGERRRIDFVVVKDNSVVNSIEVTSETADKTQQMAKEERIREAGGNYIRTYDGALAKFPDDLTTHIERRA